MYGKILALFAARPLAATSQVALAQAADMVIYNADIRTMDDDQKLVDAPLCMAQFVRYSCVSKTRARLSS